MGGDGDLLDRAEQYRQEKFARLAEALEANRRRETKDFDLLEFAVAIGDAEVGQLRADDGAGMKIGSRLVKQSSSPVAESIRLRSRARAMPAM